MGLPSPLLDSKLSHLPPPPPYSLTAEDSIPVTTASPAGQSTQEPTDIDTTHLSAILSNSDPRSSSSQSLLTPERSDTDKRRTLLVIYIHGFYGNDQSFRSFPAHVHDRLREALEETHVIHSKIYPRYKTYKSIDVARDNFSAWLEPHESHSTDVVLVGHSMGGLLAAEVVLKLNDRLGQSYPFKHRIVGNLSLDSPFLGLHPGIVVSGISSLFQPAQSPLSPTTDDASFIAPTPGSPGASTEPLSPKLSGAETPASPRLSVDPNYDPPFFNDDPFREQPFMQRMINFASKHRAEGLLNAMGNHITSHLEFGGCLADYPGLLSRYKKIRTLEDPKPSPREPRVRFANYYTLSSGRRKPSSPEPEVASPQSQSKVEDEASSDEEADPDIYATARNSIEEAEAETDLAHVASHISLQELDPMPMPAEPVQTQTSLSSSSSALDLASLNLTSLPPLPTKPEPPANLAQIQDKDAKRQAEKEYKRLLKAYEQALKDRDKTLRDREKLLAKLRKKTLKESERRGKDERKEAEKQAKESRKELEKLEKEVLKQEKENKKAAERLDRDIKKENERLEKEAKKEKKRLEREAAQSHKKLGKFCTLPMKGSNGQRDSAWVDVYMDGVDEVGAHCGLFLPGEHYDKLVGDVGGMIAAWVKEDLERDGVA